MGFTNTGKIMNNYGYRRKWRLGYFTGNKQIIVSVIDLVLGNSSGFVPANGINLDEIAERN